MSKKADYETEQALRQLAGACCEVLKEIYQKDIGFALFMYEHDRPGRTNYISNSNREDMVVALEETLQRLKNNEDSSELSDI